MDRNVSFSARSLLLAGLVALALLAAFLVGNARSAPAHADSPSGGRTVTVTGVGHVSVVPDQLGFQLSVSLVRDDLETALQNTNAAMQSVVDTLKAAGVTDRDVQTTDLSMNPEYDKHSTLKGYRVSQTVSVTVEDLTKASDIVTAAVGAGGTGVRLEGMALQVGDPEASLTPARSDAFAQARAKAEEYAADTGRELGEVVRIGDSSAQPLSSEVPYRAAADSASAGSIPIPIQTGADDLTASVVVVFALD